MLFFRSAQRRKPLKSLTSIAIFLSVSCAQDTSSRPGAPAASKEPRLTLTAIGGATSSVCYSPDGKWVATSYGESLGASDSPPGQFPSGAPDSRHSLRQVKIWDASTGEVRRTINKGPLTYALAFYPDGKQLAGSEAGAVKVWNVANGQELLIVRGHREEVRALAVSRDGKRLLAGSSDGVVNVWGPPPAPPRPAYEHRPASTSSHSPRTEGERRRPGGMRSSSLRSESGI
jgi:WD40 repeat protein